MKNNKNAEEEKQFKEVKPVNGLDDMPVKNKATDNVKKTVQENGLNQAKNSKNELKPGTSIGDE